MQRHLEAVIEERNSLRRSLEAAIRVIRERSSEPEGGPERAFLRSLPAKESDRG